jgi:hypothetical protein
VAYRIRSLDDRSIGNWIAERYAKLDDVRPTSFEG